MEAKKTRSIKEIGFNNDKLLDHINRRIDTLVAQALERLIGACIKHDELSSILSNGSFHIGRLTTDLIHADNVVANSVSSEKLSGAFDHLIANSLECGLISSGKVQADEMFTDKMSSFECDSISANSIGTGKLCATGGLIGDLECATIATSKATLGSISAEKLECDDVYSISTTCNDLTSKNCLISGDLNVKHIKASSIDSDSMRSKHGSICYLTSSSVESDDILASDLDVDNIIAGSIDGTPIHSVIGPIAELISQEDGLLVSERGHVKTIRVSDINHDDLSGLDTKSHSQYVQLKPDREAGQIIEGSLSMRGLDAVELSAQSAIFLKSTTMESGTQPIPLPVIRAASEFKGRNPQIAMLGGKVMLSNNGKLSTIGEVVSAGKAIVGATVKLDGSAVLSSLPVDVLSCIIEVRTVDGYRPDFKITNITTNSLSLLFDSSMAGRNIRVLLSEVK